MYSLWVVMLVFFKHSDHITTRKLYITTWFLAHYDFQLEQNYCKQYVYYDLRFVHNDFKLNHYDPQSVHNDLYFVNNNLCFDNNQI